MPFAFRDAQLPDVEQLWRLDHACFPPGIAYSRQEIIYFMKMAGSFTILAEQIKGKSQSLAGFILAQKQKNNWGHVITIDVDQDFRRTGLGMQLMTLAEERLARAGCKAMYLETAVDNHPAIRFYEKLKYERVKTIPGYYNGKIDAHRMQKPLLIPLTPKK